MSDASELYELMSKKRLFPKGTQETLEGKIRADVAGRNAELPFYRPTSINVIPKELTASGWVPRTGKYANEVFMGEVSDNASGRYANTTSHEGYHQRTGRDPQTYPKYNAFGALNSLRQLMQAATNPARPTENWGLNFRDSPEELIASLKGYEGSLPKGTSIMDTAIGQKVLPDQTLQDMYFSLSSHPHKGIWEGQSQPPLTEQVIGALSKLFSRKEQK